MDLQITLFIWGKKRNCEAKFPMCLFVKKSKKKQTIFKDGMTFLFSEL